MKTLVSYPKLSWMRDSSSLGEMVPFSKLSWFHQVITLALAAVACAKPQLLGPETQLLLGAEAQLPALGLGQVQVRSQSPQAIYYHVQTYDNEPARPAIQPVAVQPALAYHHQPQQYYYTPQAYNQYNPYLHHNQYNPYLYNHGLNHFAGYPYHLGHFAHQAAHPAFYNQAAAPFLINPEQAQLANPEQLAAHQQQIQLQ